MGVGISEGVPIGDEGNERNEGDEGSGSAFPKVHPAS